MTRGSSAVAPAAEGFYIDGSSPQPGFAIMNPAPFEPADTEPPRPRNLMQRIWDGYVSGLGSIVGATSRAFSRMGGFTARNPGLVFWSLLLFAIVVNVGWVRFRVEVESTVLWVPQKGKSVDDKNYVSSNYPKTQGGMSFYAQLQDSKQSMYGGDNAIQLSVTWEMFQLHNKIMNITVADDNGAPVTYTNLCAKNADGTSCNLASGYLWYWYKNFTYFVNAVQGSTTDPLAGNETSFRSQVSQITYPDGNPVSLLSVFGGTTYASTTPSRLTSAQVIASDYNLDNSVSSATAKRWNDAARDLLLNQKSSFQYMTYTFITGSSVGEELSASINEDMKLIIASLVVFVVIAVLFYTQLDLVKTRTSLALIGVLCVALGMVSGWAWGLIFGMPFTPLQELSPFILLGMGIDVIFILGKAYDVIMYREPHLSVEESFSKLMGTAGLSVLVTLMASILAFALGTSDDLNSVKWFSGFATLNAVMILLLMLTAWVAYMVWTEKRILGGRFDFCCCCGRDPKPATAAGVPVAQPVNGANSDGKDAGNGREGGQGQNGIGSHRMSGDSAHVGVGNGHTNGSSHGAGNGDVSAVATSNPHYHKENIVKLFFRKYYAPTLARWWVKIPILLFFILWGVGSLYGIRRIKYGQPLSDLAPDGSYVQDYDHEQSNTYNQQVGQTAGLYFRNFDPSSPAEQYKMLKALDLVVSDHMFNASNTAFLTNWLVSFISFAQKAGYTVAMPVNNCYNPLVGKVTGALSTIITPSNITGCIPQAAFYPLFTQFIARYPSIQNYVLRNSAGNITGSVMLVSQSAPGDDDRYTSNLMKEVTTIEDDINDQLFAAENDAAGTYCAFVYGSQYVSNEGDLILPHSTLQYFLLALAGVFVVTTFMLVNPVASLLMAIAVGLVILYLFGELYALKIRFNEVSVINMIMATGLSVDYAVYFAQKFMTVTGDGTGNCRMVVALGDTGYSVFLGGFTALCGSVPMAFSKSTIIRTFFRLIFGTIIFALMVGLILMPVLFSWLNLPPIKSVLTGDAQPPPSEEEEDRKQQQQQKPEDIKQDMEAGK